MRLEDMLKDISGITNQVVKTNCFEGQNTLLESILLLQSKMNEVIQAINDGIIKGDKGDTPNVQVGTTETLEPNSDASVTQTGDMLNPILNFAIPKGEKGDKGDSGKASESIQDDIISLDTCYSSEKTVSLFNDLKNVQGVKYGNDVGYQVCKGTHNGIVKDIKIYGKSEVIDGKIVSVGNGNKIEVLSSNSNIAYNMKNVKSTDGTTIALDTIAFDSVLIKEGSQYTVKSSASGTLYYKGTYCTGLNENVEKTFTLPSPTRPNDKFPFSIYKSGGDISINENTYIMLSLGDKLSSEKYNKQDKKTILFRDTDNTWKPVTNLRGIDENNCDIIDSVNNVFESNIVEVTYNGSETNIVQNNAYPPVNTDLLRFDINTNYGSLSVLCNKFKTLNGNDQGSEEGIRPHTNKNLFAIYISKSKLETQDLVGFKKWLQSNNITILYKLTNPLKYEINPIYPNSYDNETMISFNTGVIPCKNEFYIDSNLGSLQLETLDRLSKIEDTIYQSNIALLRGDFRTLAQMYYPEDFIKEEELTNE